MKPRATRVLPTTLRSTSATTLIRFDVSDVFKLSFSFTLAELLKNHFLFNILLPGAVLWETIWGGRWVQMPSGGYDIASFFLTKLFTISQCFSWEYLIALYKPPLPHRPTSFPPMLSPGASSRSQGDLICDATNHHHHWCLFAWRESSSSLVPVCTIHCRFPMPGDDSAYIVCVADNPRIHYCGDNSLFDPQTLSCLNYEVTS